jgi:hypothetical protein
MVDYDALAHDCMRLFADRLKAEGLGPDDPIVLAVLVKAIGSYVYVQGASDALIEAATAAVGEVCAQAKTRRLNGY